MSDNGLDAPQAQAKAVVHIRCRHSPSFEGWLLRPFLWTVPRPSSVDNTLLSALSPHFPVEANSPLSFRSPHLCQAREAGGAGIHLHPFQMWVRWTWQGAFKASFHAQSQTDMEVDMHDRPAPRLLASVTDTPSHPGDPWGLCSRSWLSHCSIYKYLS